MEDHKEYEIKRDVLNTKYVTALNQFKKVRVKVIRKAHVGCALFRIVFSKSSLICNLVFVCRVCV